MIFGLTGAARSFPARTVISEWKGAGSKGQEEVEFCLAHPVCLQTVFGVRFWCKP